MFQFNQFSVTQTIISTLIALITIFILRWFITVEERPKREIVLDGLRGYLAFFVFLHHSVFWYNSAHNGGHFEMDTKSFYFNYGRDAVAIFFMITAFLFWGKLIHSREKPINWTKLYIYRICRIVPLYLFVITCVFISICFITGFKLQQPITQYISATAKWFAGGLINSNNIAKINNFEDTGLMTAGVTWSLSLEWVFYCLLPIGGIIFYKTKINLLKYTMLFLFIGGIFYYFNKNSYGNLDFHFECFGMGIIAAYLFQNKRLAIFANTIWASCIVAICIVLFIFYCDSFTIPSLVTMGIAFILISSGNDLFGLLSLKVSRRFGQLSYSIYLLHGVILYITLHYIVGMNTVLQWSIWQYWIYLYFITVVIIVCTTITFNLIEKKGIKLSRVLYKK